MRSLKLIVPFVALCLCLAGCATFQADLARLTGASVSPSAVAVAVNLFDSAEATATNYLRLPKCTGTNGPICRSAVVTAQIIPAVKSGRLARNNLEGFLQGHPSTLGVQGDYDAMLAVINTLQGILANYPSK